MTVSYNILFNFLGLQIHVHFQYILIKEDDFSGNTLVRKMVSSYDILDIITYEMKSWVNINQVLKINYEPYTKLKNDG